MLTSKTGHRVSQRKQPNDIIYTPPSLAKICVDHVPLSAGDVVMDNAYGKGAFYDNFPTSVESQKCDISMGTDFYNVSENSVDWLITNPPYSHLTDWLKHSCKVSRRGFAYLFGWSNVTAPRIDLCNKNGFYLSKAVMMKVQNFFGMSCFVVFDNQATENVIEVDRTVWLSQDDNTLSKFGNRERGSDKIKKEI